MGDLCIFTRPTHAQEALRTRNTRLSGGDKVLPVTSQGSPSPGSRSSDHLPPTPSGAEAQRPAVDTGCKHCPGTRGRCWRPDASPFHPRYHLHTHQLAESFHPTASTCASTGGGAPHFARVCAEPRAAGGYTAPAPGKPVTAECVSGNKQSSCLSLTWSHGVSSTCPQWSPGELSWGSLHWAKLAWLSSFHLTSSLPIMFPGNASR